MTTAIDVEIRPFTVEIPEAELTDLRRRSHRDALAQQGARRRSVAGRAAGDDAGARAATGRPTTTGARPRRSSTRCRSSRPRSTGSTSTSSTCKSPHENALPLIMTHGWPGSVIELLEAVGPLTDPTAHGGSAEDAFHLVLPSLPGYGFSGEPTEVGWNAGRVAQAWAELMRRLGYTRYVAQGGDVGAAVTDAMGRQAPEGLLGIHMNLLVPALGGAHADGHRRGTRRAPTQIATFRASRLRLLPGAWPRGRRRSATPCWIHPSPWRPGCSTTTRTATTRSPAPSSTGSRRAISPGTTSSTTSRCTG